MSFDVRIRETLDGGDVVLVGNDLQMVDQLSNQAYFALFGGNIEESTPRIVENDNRIERFDYWGNALFHPDEPDFQFNSEFERSLDQIALNTEGIQRLEQIALRDLAFLSEFGEVSADITAQDINRICVVVQIALKPRYGNLVTTLLDITLGDEPGPVTPVFEFGIFEPNIFE